MCPVSQIPPPPPGSDQLVSNVVHDVCIVEAAALVRPPALDIDAGLALQVGQVEIVPGVEYGGRLKDVEVRSRVLGGKDQGHCRLGASGRTHLSVIWGRIGGVEDTEARSPPSSPSSSLEF